MSVSGLSPEEAREARAICRKLQDRLLLHPGSVHYTQGERRWDGIDHAKGLETPGFWPYYGDCSSTSTHILWRALKVGFDLPDRVNGYDWHYGFTGSQWQHGMAINVDPAVLHVGDLVFYGWRDGRPAHVAMYRGAGRVFSHGSEGGPYDAPLRYRYDVVGARRYI